MKPYPPLGILYICAHLRSKGLSVEVFDSTFSSRRQLFELLRQGPPSVLGIYANLMTRPNVVEILRVAKEAGWQTVVGGPEPGAYIGEYLDAGADIVVIGEGEITLEELVPALRSNSIDALQHVKGIAFRAADGTRHPHPTARSDPRHRCSALARSRGNRLSPLSGGLARAPWHGVSVSHHGSRMPLSLPLVQPRSVWQNPPPQKTGVCRRELEWLINRYQPEMAWMADDVFTIHHGWLFQYADELKQRGSSCLSSVFPAPTG